MILPGSFYSIKPFTVTNDEFFAFHSIDRAVYSSLIFAVNRDQKESLHVMAFWLWLEYYNKHGRNFVQKLLTFPFGFVNLLAQESLKCLRFVGDDSIMMHEWSRDLNDIPLLHSALGAPINLFYLMQNRIHIREGVEKILNETCLRAFEDIFMSKSGLVRSVAQSSAPVPLFAHGENVGMIGEGSMYVPYVIGYENRNMLRNVMHEGVEFGYQNHPEMENVEADQRTIFLTFSKGYPTSALEVHEFFTRRYGDVVEAVLMQDVSPEEQALYARLVVRTAGLIGIILQGGSKAKFTINSKHVWARKYIKKPSQTN